MEIASKQVFLEHYGRFSVQDLSQEIFAETGHVLQAKSRGKALDEAYEAYVAHARGKSAAGADPAGGGDNSPPSALPAGPVPSADLIYEARSRTGRTFRRGGRVFGVKYEPIGTLTADERADLDKVSMHVQYRIRG